MCDIVKKTGRNKKMDKLRIFLNSKIGWIMEVLITVTILFTSLFLPTAFVDMAVSVTIILMVVGVYAIYGFFFNKEKRTAYGFLLFNIFLSMMFANRLYIYDNLVHIFRLLIKWIRELVFLRFSCW